MEENYVQPVGAKKIPLTPEVIVGKLFSFHDAAHFLHLQTKSFSEHKALDDVYNSLEESADSISEYLLGIQAPARLGAIQIDAVPPYSEGCVLRLAQSIFDFSVRLCDYAENKNLEELCNLASDFQQIAVKLKYMNSLK